MRKPRRCPALLLVPLLFALAACAAAGATDAPDGASDALAALDAGAEVGPPPPSDVPPADAGPDADPTADAAPDLPPPADLGPVSAVGLRFALQDGDFFALPFPADARRRPDGSLGFGDWPGASRNGLLRLWTAAADELLDGWGVTSAALLFFDGPLDGATLPPEDRFESDGPVLLVDVDPASPERGWRYPLACRYTAAERTWQPAHTVACRTPVGLTRRPATRYAVIVTDGLRAADGGRLAQSPSMAALLAGEDVGALSGAAHADAVAAAGLDPQRVRAVVRFTTVDPSARLRRIAAFYRTLPDPLPEGPLELLAVFEDYVVLAGRVRLPVIQSGTRPYQTDGRIVFGDDGQPQVVEEQSARFAVSVPRQPMPAGGFPVVLYMHGSGGEWLQFVHRGPRSDPRPGRGVALAAAERGMAAMGFDFPFHGDRADPPDESGLLLYNLTGNPRATIDNFIVAACEVNRHVRLLRNLAIDPAVAPAFLDAGAAPDGLIRFASDDIVSMGQSMGSTIGLPAATVDEHLDGIILGGAGGTLLEVALHATSPFDLVPVLRTVFQLQPDEPLDEFDPVLNLAQHFWDLVDPVAHARHLVREPHDGVRPKHVLHVHGLGDTYFSPHARAAISLAAGLDVLAPLLEPALEDYLARGGGVLRHAAEVVGNRGEGRTTAVVVQYDRRPNDGHTVTFELTDCRAQWSCFARTARGADPPVVRAAATAAGPCP
jgi:hypothetical protein